LRASGSVSNLAGSGTMDRRADLIRLYDILGHIEAHLGGKRSLADDQRGVAWPGRGVYFFFELGEARSDTGTGSRVVRIGTHALKSGSRTTLRQRMGQHRGTRALGGNHRGSIFRLLVGAAIRNRDHRNDATSWGIRGHPGAAALQFGISREQILQDEAQLEIAVSEHIRSMLFVWISVDDPPGPDSVRGLVERNSIALLSNHRRPPLDPPSKGWLGTYCDRDRVRQSGLWNNSHVDEQHEPEFLNVLERLAR
jgi:hypothetical protein